MEVLQALAGHGQHRAPSIADLLIAAVAECAQLTILHAGKDFELIAGITAQLAERLKEAQPRAPQPVPITGTYIPSDDRVSGARRGHQGVSAGGRNLAQS